ncbi:MAG: hypothetical protein FWH04_06660 [Oscillospiraceae bacterium]|nr:hypothetical protein [Oscillospiraceae bacterium]
MKKDFWNRWWIVFAFSAPIYIVSKVLALLSMALGSGLSSLGYFFFGLPIICYILTFVVSFFVCKRNIKQAIVVASTSPTSIYAYGWLIFLAGAELGIWW